MSFHTPIRLSIIHGGYVDVYINSLGTVEPFGTGSKVSAGGAVYKVQESPEQIQAMVEAVHTEE